MRFKTILSLATLSLPFLAVARPASPELLRLHNPDGSVVEARLHGDEFFSYTTTADGLTILEPAEGGFWKPAVRQGRTLRPVDADLTLLRSERAIDVRSQERMQRMAALDSEGRSTFPTIGSDVHSPVVLIEYSDTKFTVPDIHQAIYNLCNERGYSAYGAKGSAADYFRSVSNGLFSPVFDIYGPVTMQHPSVWYTGADDPNIIGSGKNGRFCDAIYEVINILDPDVDFSIYDYDNDGKIDNIFFFYAGFGQADSGDRTTIWPHQGDYTERVKYLGYPELHADGKEVATYACSNELEGGILPAGEQHPYLDGIGAFCHEFSHVLGLPDLYDTQNSGCVTPGNWSVMANGTYNDRSTCPPMFSGYEQWLCNWLEYEIAEDDTDYEIPSLTSGSPKAVRINIPRPGTGKPYPEYFVMESRSLDGWDAALPDEGLLIWRIDYNKNTWTSNTVNTYNRPRVKIMAASESEKQYTWPGWDNAYTVSYPGCEGALEPQSSMSPSFVAFLTDIAWDGDNRVATLGYNHIKQLPQEITVLHDDIKATDGKREFKLEWEPVEGADEYLVTVLRTDAAGKEWAVDGYRETSVGQATEALVRNMSATAWDQEFRAYVRVAKMGIPSAKTSNVVTFVPSELPVDGAGISAVSPDQMGVSAGQGYIVAPAGAEVYNMSGARCGTQGLPAGIYVVRVGAQTAKVMVR